MKKIAFCFLLYDSIKHSSIWEKFFNQDKNTHTIYAHLKKTNSKTQKWIKKYKIKPVKTDYCSVTLVYAWITLLKSALKDPNNKYFVILSGECIPLFPYKKTYRKITASKKSRLNIDLLAESYFDTGLYWADQWCILNRKQAELLIKLKTTSTGRKFVRDVIKKVGHYCPDEIIPVNWFVKHYGKPSTKKYKKEIRNIPTTYTYWDGIHYQPRKFTLPQLNKMKKQICDSKAVFGRKFYMSAAKQISMNC